MRPRSYPLLILMVMLGVLSVLSLRGIAPTFAYNQLFFFLVGLVVFVVTSAFPARTWENGRWLWYAGVVGLLLLTIILGQATKGAVSWLEIGAYRLQPSELLKPVLMLLLASEFARGSWEHPRQLLKFMVLAGLPLALIMLQPDFGTALTVVAGVGALFLLTSPPKKLVVGLGAGAVAMLVIAWLFVFQPYQKDRIRTFIQPTQDVQGSGYNAQQAMIAVGSGGITGRGLGQGSQSHLRFLPERQTDFLFATYAEERGFLGSAWLIGLYTALLAVLGKVSQEVADAKQRLFILSSGAILLFQSFINIGMNMGLTPVTEIPLPLFSLGGSSILATSITLGLAESIRRSSLPVKQHLK